MREFEGWRLVGLLQLGGGAGSKVGNGRRLSREEKGGGRGKSCQLFKVKMTAKSSNHFYTIEVSQSEAGFNFHTQINSQNLVSPLLLEKKSQSYGHLP